MRTKLTDTLWEIEPGCSLEIHASSGETFMLSLPDRNPGGDYEMQETIANFLQEKGYVSEAYQILDIASNNLVESCIRKAPRIRRYRVLRTLSYSSCRKGLGWWSFYRISCKEHGVNNEYLQNMARKLFMASLNIVGY
jgi:hypothetical protein